MVGHSPLLVPEMGLEPIWISPFDFKSNAYTNSATRARFARPRFANGLTPVIISHDSGNCHCCVAGGGDELADGFGAAVANGENAWAGGFAVLAGHNVAFFI